MSREHDALSGLRGNSRLLMEALRRDWWKIVALALLAAAAGGAAGKLTNTARSTAQLLLTPAPVRDNYDTERGLWQYSADESSLVRMMARPLEANTAVLLCMSDGVMQRTFDELGEPGVLSAPPASINSLKNALSCEVSLDIETPYEVRYSPVIRLQAAARVPADAAAMVNAWAAVCVEKAAEFQAARQQPQAEAFAQAAGELEMEGGIAAQRSGDPAATAGDGGPPFLAMDTVIRNDMASKARYAAMAAEFGREPLRLLTPGAEWRLPRFRRALLFGGIAGAWGLALGIALSLGARMILFPQKDGV
jgi:hypothetical protein